MIRSIAWATDGSPTARHAFTVARELARAHAARLLVVHVQETGITRAGLLADENDDIPVALERVVTDLRNDGIDAELIVGRARDTPEELTSMPLSPHEKPLSPHEQTILAAVEEEFRADDPALAAALSPIPPGAHGAEVARTPARSAWSALPTGIQYGAPLLAVVLFLVAQPLIPPSWRAVLGVALWLVVLPVVFLRFFGRTERHDTSA